MNFYKKWFFMIAFLLVASNIINASDFGKSTAEKKENSIKTNLIHEIIDATRSIGAGIATFYCYNVSRFGYGLHQDLLAISGNALNILYPTDQRKFRRFLYTLFGYGLAGYIKARS